MDLGGLADKAKKALDSEKGEQHSDQALDKVSDVVDERTGGKHAEHITKGRDAVDERLGQQERPAP